MFMSDAINALKGFPFEQFFCLLMFGIVVWVLAVLNKTLHQLERTIYGQAYTIAKALERIDKCQDSGKVS